MDFQTLKRRDLQALCKKNNIPANITNAAMADALASLDIVEGIEEFLRQCEAGGSESPERSVSRTSTRQKATKEDLEGSKTATRTRCSTRRRAVEGTETRMTSTTRTTRKRAPQEAPIQGKMEKELQAEFEADLKLSEISENNELGGGESTEVSEVSGVSVEQQGHVSSETHDESKEELPQVNEDDNQDNLEEGHVVDEAQEDTTEMFHGSQKVDFHSLSRKELQMLCKKNKIPANITNAAMADNLESLENVEGLEELLQEQDSLAAKSPELSRMTSSRVRQARTCQKTYARRKPAVAGSALGKIETVQKKEDSVVQSLTKKMDLDLEDTECPVSNSKGQDGLLVQEENDVHLEACLEKSELLECVSENSSSVNVELKSGEVSNESDSSVVVEVGEEVVAQSDTISSDESKVDEGLMEEAPEVGNERPKETDISDSLEDEPKSEDDKGDDGFNAKNVMQPGDLKTEIDGNVFEDLIVEDLNFADDFADDFIDIAEDADGGHNPEANCATSDEDLEFSSTSVEAQEFSSSGIINEDSESEKLITSISAAACPVEKFEGSQEEDSELITQADEPAPIADGSQAEHQMTKEFDTVLTTQADEHAPVAVGSQAEHQMTLPLDSEPTTQADEHVAKVEGSQADGLMTVKFDFEPSTQADAPKVNGTPLAHKSLRKLKKMLKQKLQATTSLENKMEKMTLEESEIPLDSNSSDAQLTKDVEGFEGTEETLCGDQLAGNSANVPVADIVDAAVLCPILLDHDISKDSVVGHIDIDQQRTGEKQCSELVPLEQVDAIESDNVTCPPITPSKSSTKAPKPLLVTPSKTPKSALLRTNSVLDSNKENIDKSANKTGPGKIEIGSGKLLSAMSIGKLKKEFKVLQQKSDRKRPALQSRSDNQCPLASP